MSFYYQAVIKISLQKAEMRGINWSNLNLSSKGLSRATLMNKLALNP
jgi:hypothetical protein